MRRWRFCRSGSEGGFLGWVGGLAGAGKGLIASAVGRLDRRWPPHLTTRLYSI